MVERAKPRVGPTYRWIVLAAMSLICLAQYYVYDSITPLGTMLKEQLGYSASDYGLLFSFYAVANVFLLMLVLAGVLVDKLGLKISGILYGFLCVAGAALTALGSWDGLRQLPGYAFIDRGFLPEWSGSLKVMLLGRMVYGVGAEAILVVNNKVLARWFRGRELAFAYGANLTLMRLGTFLALTLQARVATAWGLIPALWTAVVIMAMGLGTFFIYLLLEHLARGREGAPSAGAGMAADEKFVLKEAFSFDTSFWLITLLCVTFYSAVFPFQSFAPDILVQKFGYSVETAADVTSALIVGTMICTPILGWYVDHRGRRASIMMLGAGLLIPCHLLLGYTRFPPIVLIFLVGVSLSLVPAAMWAAIPLMVPDRRLGTAFGVVGYVQNMGLMLFPYLAGRISDAHTTSVGGHSVVDYSATLTMFAALGIVGFVFAILLKRADRARGAVLERPK